MSASPLFRSKPEQLMSTLDIFFPASHIHSSIYQAGYQSALSAETHNEDTYENNFDMNQ